MKDGKKDKIIKPKKIKVQINPLKKVKKLMEMVKKVFQKEKVILNHMVKINLSAKTRATVKKRD